MKELKKKETNSTKTVEKDKYSHYYHILRLKLQIFFKNMRHNKDSQCVIKLFKKFFFQ